MTTVSLLKDPVVRGCLAKIKRGDVSAVGVLADYLEESSMPIAKKVRAAWDRANYWIAYWSNPELDMGRRKYTRWEKIAFSRRWLRYRINMLFTMRWKRLPITAYKSST